ncbi:MAG: enoyl-CoA hydratase/isomerase family protein [Anaerolineaceae bacterium]|nr:enoyl-CoA hydratase/isomerase family protein [Anaerolineaceae bacterium]
MTEKILLESYPDGVTVLMFNRPQARNALDLESMRLFAETVSCLREDAGLRVVVLTGAGEQAFCSGGDLVELSNYPSEADAINMITLMGDALLTLERLPVPVIAAINGYALGGGSEIALACDMRIVDEAVQLGLVQIRLGLTPGWGAGQRLLRVVGYARAMDLLLRGHVLHASEIEELGLANRIVEQGSALPQALRVARQIAAAPPDTVRGVKALLQAGMNHPYEMALQIERAVFPPLWAAEPHLKAVNDFLNRRKSPDSDTES